MDKHKDLSDFDKGQIVMARRLGQSISKAAGLVGCSRSAVVSTYKMWSKEGQPVKRRVCPLGPKRSSPATSSTSEAELPRPAKTEKSLAVTEAVLSPTKQSPAAPQSSSAVKTPVQPKSRRQSTATTRAAGSAALDDLDGLMNEFADDPLDGEVELDPAVDEDNLLLELSEMIDS